MLTFLKPSDFYVTARSELANKIAGFSIVSFTSDSCKYCKDVMPSFVRVSASLQGCSFAVMNVDQDYQRIVAMSAATKNPLRYVPCVLFYVNGVPVAEYETDESDPSANYAKIRQFVIDQTNKYNSGRRDASSRPTETMATSPNTIGIPANKKKGVCYLTYERAYGQAAARA